MAMDTDLTLERGRDAYGRKAWAEAYQHLSSADEQAELAPADLERLATAAHLNGRDAAADAIWARAHQGFLDADDPAGAVRCAFWLGFGLLQRGETAQGGGWLGRARRLCEERGLDCAEQGYLLTAAGLMQMERGDAVAAVATFDEVIAIGTRFGAPEVTAFGRLGRGEALIRSGRVDEGVALLDEVMVAVTSGELSSRVSGIVYCAVVDTCQQLFDVRRAQEWTEALARWSDLQPELVPYRGQCLVHRSQLMQLHGRWGDAVHEAQQARDRLSDPPHPAIALAYYQLGELHRLRGEFAGAEDAFRRANELGHHPYPGLALLWLAQGRVRDAETAIRNALDDAQDHLTRSQLLPASIEILLAADQADAARGAADELCQIAAGFDAPLVRAMAGQWSGAVRLAQGDTGGALDELRAAWELWRELDVPYEAARTRVLIGSLHHAGGDAATARLEWDAARRTFEDLGAGPALAWLDEVVGVPSGAPGPLTPREIEVLRLVADGRTNRQIAEDLVISEKTVERHLSNVFTKVDVSNRAAATAYAYEHDLV